jgi:hypothetical protein
MTGFRSRWLRHQCTDDTCYLQLLPWWDDICDCFDNPNKAHPIRPTDIDGMVEINGHFLFLEEKSAGASVPHGQRVAYERMTALAPGRVTVMFVRPVYAPGGSDEIPDPVEVLTYPEAAGWQRMTRQAFLDRLRCWALEARSA